MNTDIVITITYEEIANLLQDNYTPKGFKYKSHKTSNNDVQYVFTVENKPISEAVAAETPVAPVVTKKSEPEQPSDYGIGPIPLPTVLA